MSLSVPIASDPDSVNLNWTLKWFTRRGNCSSRA
jgi:hypothetical protein